MRVFKKDEIRFIGHFRGFSQYEVLDDMSLLLLESNGKYYLSKVDDLTQYNTNIAVRIHHFYGDEGIKALGELVEVK